MTDYKQPFMTSEHKSSTILGCFIALVIGSVLIQAPGCAAEAEKRQAAKAQVEAVQLQITLEAMRKTEGK